MARKNQRLINFHTSGLTSMPVASDVHYGEIVVRHNKQQPELLIKVSESEFGVIPGSGAVASAISVAAKNVTDYVDREVNTIESSITSLQKAVSAVSTNIGENYVSNEAFKTAQGQLFTSATTVASNDATTKANNAKNDAINAAAASAKTLQNNIDSANGRINTVSGNLNSFKTDVANTYETKDNVTTAITAAKNSVYSSATTAAAADAQSKADGAKTAAIKAAAASADTLNSSIEAVDDRVDTVSGNLNTFKTNVANTYATKTGVTSDITAAKTSVYGSGTTAAAADATTKANNAKSDAIAAAAASAETLNNSIEAVDGKVSTLSGNVHTTIANVQTALTQTINNKVATAYRYKGSCTYAQLTGKTAEFTGEVWNVTDANGNFPAGTNYAWDGKKWDALGGSVDLSPYALKTEVTGATKTLQDNIDAANRRIDTVSGNLNTFKADVAKTYATKTGVTSDITSAKNSVYSSATTAAAADAKKKADDAKSGAIAAAAASAKTLQTNIDAANGRIDTVSTSLNTFKTTVADTYATKTGVTSDIKDAKDSVYSSATTAAAADAKKKADAAYSSATTAAAASAKTLNSSIEAVDDRVDTVSGNLNTFKTNVANTYATKTGVTSDITAAKTSVYSSATTAAAADAKSKADTAYSSATTAAAASAKTLNDRIDGVASKVSTLSASTVSIKATADKAVQTGTTNNGSGVVVTKNGTSLDFDFSGLIIDCGDF